MKFTYVGQHETSPAKTRVFGYEFTKDGAAVDVKEDKFIKKLEGNPSFKKVAAKKAAKKTEPISFG